MEWTNPYISTNKSGIVGIESIGVEQTATAMVFSFRPHRMLNYPFRGLLLIKLQAFTAPTNALPIQLTTAGGTTINLTDVGGTNVTTTELTSAGVYLCWYSDGVLQLLSRTA